MVPNNGLDEEPLRVATYVAVFRAIEWLELPDFPGSAWRGAMGHALKRLVCVTGMQDCTACHR